MIFYSFSQFLFWQKYPLHSSLKMSIFGEIRKRFLFSLLLSSPLTMASDILACQRDWALKELETIVISCSRAPRVAQGAKNAKKGKQNKGKQQEKEEKELWVALLNDTVLYPEGGGQPADHGSFILFDEDGEKNGKTIAVVDVQRRSNGPVEHFITEEVKEGSRALVQLDWERRRDHSVHHTAQHLISALAFRFYGWPTVSWWLGTKECNVEFSIPKLPDEEKGKDGERGDDEINGQIERIEIAANEGIAKNLSVRTYIADDCCDSSKPEEKDVYARWLAEQKRDKEKSEEKDKKKIGRTRIVEIDELKDLNQCGGTHIPCLSHIQVISLSRWERSRGNLRIFFNASLRVLSALKEREKVERELSGLLSVGIGEFSSAVKSLQLSLRTTTRQKKNLLEDISRLQAKKLKDESESGLGDGEEEKDIKRKVVVHHREDGDLGYLQTLNTLLRDGSSPFYLNPSVVSILSCGSRGDGMFLISGGDGVVDQKKKEICELIEGKGGGKKGVFQGKASKLHRINEVVEILV